MRSLIAALTILFAHSVCGAEQTSTSKSRDLFNGKNLDGWKVTEFGGEGEIKVKDGEIICNMGASLSGIHYTNALPKTRYEVSLEAKKIDGSDFFCALTFPVNETHCTLVLGGWGGGVVGLSSIDGMDASENDTTKYVTFKQDKWYKVRVRVEPERIRAWLDEDEIVNQDIKGREVGLRFGPIDLQKPLGLSTYQTTAAWKSIRVSDLPAETKPGTAGKK